jgi:putative hemolysin
MWTVLVIFATVTDIQLLKHKRVFLESLSSVFLFQQTDTLTVVHTVLQSGVDWGTVSTLVLVMVLGLILSALFSSAEVAFFSLSGNLSPDDIEEAKTNPVFRRVLNMLEKPRRLLSTILIGNTVANIVSAVMAAVVTGELLVLFDIPDYIVYTVEVMVLTAIIVILSEITPKILALKNPKKVAMSLSLFLNVFYILFAPLAKWLGATAASLEKRLPKPSDKFSSEDLRTIAEVGELQGSIQEDEREIIENVIEFGNTTVREIMTSRVDVIAVSTEDTLSEVMQLIRDKSVSRMPLYQDDLDHILGIIHTKDLLPFIDKSDRETVIYWKQIARKAIFIPPSKKLDDLLRDFQRERTHVAVVVDEYGGTEGIVSMDDVLEEIIGEMNDEYSGQETLFTRRKNGDYIFDAKIDLDDLADILGVDIVGNNDDYETLGGLIYHLLERIPEAGEKVTFKKLHLTVHKVENNRVTKVVVSSITPTQDKDKN